MGNSFVAHIFGRSRRGDREEVKIQLFNDDGSPADLGAGGGGGGGDATSPVILDLDFLRDPTTDGSVAADASAPVAIQNVRRRYGIALDVGDTEFELPAGVYLAWLVGDISTYNEADGAVPADGSWLIAGAADNTLYYFDNPVDPPASGLASIQPQPFQSSGGPLHIALNNDYSVSTDGGISGQVRVIIVSVGFYF